jgi:hypothetical protein
MSRACCRLLGPRWVALHWLAAFLLILHPSAASAQTPPSISVVGLDYAYQGPATAPPGLTTFAFENRGAVRHEMILLRLNAGVTLDSLLRIPQGPARFEVSEVVGILIAGPGRSPLGRLVVDLERGRTYALVCNFQDAPDKPRHAALGMVASLYVK